MSKKAYQFFLYVGGNVTFFSSNTAAEVANVIIGRRRKNQQMTQVFIHSFIHSVFRWIIPVVLISTRGD